MALIGTITSVYIYGTPSAVNLFSFLADVNIYDVLALCGDETKLREWMRSYRVLCDPPSKCFKCDCALKACCVYNGKPYVKEFQRKANLNKDKDAFLALMECIRDVHFQ